MADTVLDIPTFRAMFKAFSDEIAYPDSVLNLWYPIGKCYINDNDATLPADCRAQAFMLMLAHLIYIQDQISTGNMTAVVTSASEGAVSVSLAEPPTSGNFSYWLNTTPYGQQIMALLDVASVGGFYVGGSLDRYGFRKANGGF